MLSRGSTKVGRCAARRAESFVGVREDPPGSNRGHLIDRWNLAAGAPLGSAWCMAFQHAMYLACGVVLGGWASVGNFELWAKAHGYEVTRPWRGCLMCIEWGQDSWPDHVEIVTRVIGLAWRGGRFVGWVQTVGGNTGNAVSRRTRKVRPDWRFVQIPD